MKQSEFSAKILELSQHRERLAKFSTTRLFAENPNRFDEMSVEFGKLLFDYSKNRLDQQAMGELIKLAESSDIEGHRNAMFGGNKINKTEDRAAVHTALRNRTSKPVFVDGKDVMPDVLAVLDRLRIFSDDVRTGRYKPSGQPITDCVNIGIGGSDLGPRMVVEALRPYNDGPKMHFIANVDGADIADTLKELNPATTLFVVASKTFTTQETMTNARTAFAWMEKALGDATASHFVAVSTNLEATGAFGIPAERTFGFWDWVGGRFSVWSAIGLPVMLAVGSTRFEAFLEGAHAADVHFSQSPLSCNIPVLMALIGIWHRNVCGFGAHAVLPYDQRLADFPRWLQQLDMESNGKSVLMEGSTAPYATGPVVFGEPGTNGQHAFFQLLHQGSDPVPCDFLVAAHGHEAELDHQHKLLVANCLAQSQALMSGRSLDEANGNPHRVFSGSRPSNTFLYEKLDPYTLGVLMAFYEHKIFVQGALWGVNSFDQWGVELGKELATKIGPLMDKPDAGELDDPSTSGLLDRFHTYRQ